MRKEFFFYAIFILGALLVYSHLLILHGSVKEREEKECVGAVAISNWENTLNIAQAICVDAQNNQLSEIKNNYHLQISKLEEDVKYWKDAYLWLKAQKNEEKKVP